MLSAHENIPIDTEDGSNVSALKAEKIEFIATIFYNKVDSTRFYFW